MENRKQSQSAGPLAGLRVVEFAGIGPAPFACMLLSDMGADVVTIERTGKKIGGPADIIARGRTVVVADLKDANSRDEVLTLLDHADVLIEGFRPGVTESLGLGPESLAQRNPKLVYGRITGWGQTGPLAHRAGHDVNSIALTGALGAIGPANGPPSIPLNLIGDYAGGSVYLVAGILAALYERQSSGKGQVFEAAITDGTISLMSLFASFALRGKYTERRGVNMLDGGAPYYNVYRTADGQYVLVGALEPKFFAELCERVGVNPDLRAYQFDGQHWPQLREEFARLFEMRTREEWEALLENTDACFAPVLTLSEAMRHPHNVERASFIEVTGVSQPAPAPRFSRTPAAVQNKIAIEPGRWRKYWHPGVSRALEGSNKICVGSFFSPHAPAAYGHARPFTDISLLFRMEKTRKCKTKDRRAGMPG
ncbi:CaiB/BaiF CoA transferase family protein [Noviherbaspirillum pedocola]|uniref:CoA transferase n=1 Tax=Noviherbaspirillum pedocola TaxID=2801341 RepID=A0A934T0C1_9BURK|nr:CaiB/BaiF CoA-transferase family protein [Noviherbaspirillum pedocola]MBK4739024.1 CoA transferase [Noviherbaspirillum pedocola]